MKSVRPRAQSVLEPALKRRCPGAQQQVTPHQTEDGRPQAHEIPQALGTRRPRRLDGVRLGRLPHPHHLLHEPPVERVPGKQRDQAVPVQQVVVDPSADQADHAHEHRPVVRDDPGRHPHRPAELAVDPFVGAARKAEGQRGGGAAVALDDVAVVPDLALVPLAPGPVQGGDGPGLQDVQPAAAKGPLDVLGPAEQGRDAAHGVGHPADLRVAERGGARCGAGHRDGSHAIRCAGGGAVRPALAGNPALHDPAARVHLVQVAVGLARHHRRAGPEGRGDRRERSVARERVRAECDSGRVRVDHPLDDHGRRRRREGQPALGTIGAHRLAEAGAPDIRDTGVHILRPHVKKALQLTGEGVLQPILVRGRGPHRQQPPPLPETDPRRGQLPADRFGRRHIRQRGPQPFRLRTGLERCALVPVEAVVEGLCVQDKPRGHREPGPGQVHQRVRLGPHASGGRILPPARDVAHVRSSTGEHASHPEPDMGGQGPETREPLDVPGPV